MFKYSNKERSKKRRVQNNFNELLNDPQSKGNPIFKNLLFFIDQDTVNVSRRIVLHRLIEKYGGRFTMTFSNYVTHVLFDEGFCNGRLNSTFTWTTYPQHMEVIMVTWLSASINANMCLNTAGYRVRSNRRSNLYRNFHSSMQDGGYSSTGKDGSSEGTKFDYVSEENSTFDDGKYDDETSCEDDWLLSEPPDIYILPTNPIDNDWLSLKEKETPEKVIPENKEIIDVAVATTSAASKITSPQKETPSEAPFASSNPIVARLSKVRVRMIPKHLRAPGERAVVVELNNENDPPLPLERVQNDDATDSVAIKPSLNSNELNTSKEEPGITNVEDKSTPKAISPLSNENISSSSKPTSESVNCNNKNSQCTVSNECLGLSSSDTASAHQIQEPATDDPQKITDSNVVPICDTSNTSESVLSKREQIHESDEKQQSVTEISGKEVIDSEKVPNQVATAEYVDELSNTKHVIESKIDADKDQSIKPDDHLIAKESCESPDKNPSPPFKTDLKSPSPDLSKSVQSLEEKTENKSNPLISDKDSTFNDVLDVKQVSANEILHKPKESIALTTTYDPGSSSNAVKSELHSNLPNVNDGIKKASEVTESEISNKEDKVDSDCESSNKESELKLPSRKIKVSTAEASDETLSKKSKDGEFTVEVLDSSSEYSTDDSVVILSSEGETMQNATSNNDSSITGSSDVPSTDTTGVYPLNLYCSSTAGFADSEHMSCEETSTDWNASEIDFSIIGPNGSAERIDSERFRERVNNDTATYVIRNQITGIHFLPPENPTFQDEYGTITTLDHFNKPSSTPSSPIINTSYEPPRAFSLTNISDPEFIFPVPEPSTSNYQGRYRIHRKHRHGRVIATRPDNPNLDIINKLKILYECHKQVGCKWRIHAYEKAILALSKQYNRVASIREVRALNGVGKRIARKIWRIAKTGDLKEIQEIHNRRWVETMKLFTRAWGISPSLAFKLYKEGFCTIYGLQKKSELSRAHLVGLRYYEDLKTKMSQEETTLIISTVLKEVFKMYPHLRADACSSLRRKKLRCGHACILLSLPSGVPNDHKIVPDIVARLHQIGFLIDDLIRHEENGDQTKYIGICRLSKKNKHRRLCITLTTKEEHPTALMYLTGPAYFNKAMQQWAVKREMVLDEHSLRFRVLNVLGGTEYVSKLHVTDESLIFQLMGLPYRAPEHRERIYS